MAKLQLKLWFLLYYRKLRYESLFVQKMSGELENRKNNHTFVYRIESKQ